MFKKNVELIDKFGSDQTVVNCARVSFNKSINEMSEKDSRLIKYLLKHKHTSPFRHCFLQWRITAPIFILRQWQKHQIGCSWNEMSRRYVDTPPDVYKFEKWHSRPDKSLKQGAGEILSDQVSANEIYNEIIEASLKSYQDLLDLNVAPEQARAVLPQSMLTSCIWTASLQSALHFVSLRAASNAQSEIRQYSDLIANDIESFFPVTYKAYRELNDY
jgi:thymidylate synthase (FAD)